MSKHTIGLVMEGGGMRGAFTAGVLDAFMDEGIKFPYVIGVSAGANNGSSYVSEQRGRSKRIYLDWSKDPRFYSFSNVLKQRSVLGMDFLFRDLPNKLEPFDGDTFTNTDTIFKVGATHCMTGRTIYFSQKSHHVEFFKDKVMRASSSLPLICPKVIIDGEDYLDGGIGDPIPIEQSMKDGNAYNVIILTQHKGYRKSPSKLTRVTQMMYKTYPNLIESLNNRHIRYNQTIKDIAVYKENSKAFVIQPTEPISISRLEKDTTKLQQLYEQGYTETLGNINQLKQWIEKVQNENVSA